MIAISARPQRQSKRRVGLAISLVLLRRYQGQWRRRDHSPRELRSLAYREVCPARREVLLALAEIRAIVRGGKLNHSAYASGSVLGRALELGASVRRWWRLAARYRRGGLRGVFREWLRCVRVGFAARLRARR